jgi:ComF family protein
MIVSVCEYNRMWLLDFIAPHYCAFCGVASEGEERSICVGCRDDLPWAEPPVSPLPTLFKYSISMLEYEFPVDVAIKAMKFNRKVFYVPAFAEILCSASQLLPADIDAVVPVPLHWRRKASRGFNQASEIAKPLARKLNVPVLRCVRRHKATSFQSGLGATERAKNLRFAFQVKESLSYKHVLLVDDIITTGATLTELARILRASGIEAVSALTIARAS